MARQYAEAIQSFSRISAPSPVHHAFMAAASAQMGNGTAASAHAREVLNREPTFTIGAHLATMHYKHEADREHHREGLSKAGLPA